jgi:CheY-like chemotaxis protein
VLIIEDNEDSAEMLATYLRFAGHEVAVADDGATGVELALDIKPSVILCDIGLPGMNGYDVARQLTGRPELASTTFVAVTGYGEAAARQRSRDAGFSHHLTKPVDPATVAELIGQGGLEAA